MAIEPSKTPPQIPRHDSVSLEQKKTPALEKDVSDRIEGPKTSDKKFSVRKIALGCNRIWESWNRALESVAHFFRKPKQEKKTHTPSPAPAPFSHISSESSSSSEEIFPLTNPLHGIEMALAATGAVVKRSHPLNEFNKLVKHRVELKDQILELSASIRKKQLALDSSEINYQPKPQANFINTCYFNAATQALEAVHGRYNKRLNELLKSGISIPRKASFDDIEKALNGWAPIPDWSSCDLKEWEAKIDDLNVKVSQVDVTELRKKQQLQSKVLELQNEYHQIKTIKEAPEKLKTAEEQLKNAQDNKTLKKAVEDIKFYKKQILLRQDRILFKQSYINLLYAKRYGSKEDAKKALKLHHDTCFTIEQMGELSGQHNRTSQLDGAFYFGLWHNMLGLNSKGITYWDGKKGDRSWIGDPSFAPVSYLSVAVKDNVKACVEDYFNESVRGDNAFEINDSQIKKNESSIQDLYSRKKNHRKIDKLEKENIKLKDNISELVTVRAHDGVDLYDFDKLFRFLTPPPTLILQLKRFTEEGGKITKKVAFERGKNFLDLDRYFDPENEDIENHGARYQLTSFTLHKGGGIGSGHYIAYVRQDNRRWYCMDDEKKPELLEVADVPFEKAYMLCYQRVLVKKKKVKVKQEAS